MPDQKQPAILFVEEPGPELQSLTHVFAIEEYQAYLVVGVDGARNVKSIDLVLAREGSTVAGLAEGISKVATLALQYGVPLQAVIAELKDMYFEPRGRVTNRREIGMRSVDVPAVIPLVKSVLDYVARWLEAKFVRNEPDGLTEVLLTPPEEEMQLEPQMDQRVFESPEEWRSRPFGP